MIRLFTKLFRKFFGSKLTPEQQILAMATKEFSKCRNFDELRAVNYKFQEIIIQEFVPLLSPYPFLKDRIKLISGISELYWDQHQYITRLNSIK